MSSADYRGYKVVFIIIYKPYGIQYREITTKELSRKGFWLVVWVGESLFMGIVGDGRGWLVGKIQRGDGGSDVAWVGE